MGNLFRHVKPVPQKVDSHVGLLGASDFDLYFYNDGQDYLDCLDGSGYSDLDDYSPYRYDSYSTYWEGRDDHYGWRIPTTEEIWDEHEREMYDNRFDCCSSEVCRICGNGLDDEYEFDASYSNAQHQVVFDQSELFAHQGRKTAKARRRDQAIRHHARRARAAKIVDCQWAASRRADRAVNGNPTEATPPKPHLAHSGSLRWRSSGGYEPTDRRRDQKWLRVELDQAGAELAEMM